MTRFLSSLVVAGVIAFLAWTLVEAIRKGEFSFVAGNVLIHPVLVRRESHPTLFWLSAAVIALTVVVLLVVLASMLFSEGTG